jgi:hypothetical protein
MRKTILSVLFVTVLIMLSGCGWFGGDDDEPTDEVSLELVTGQDTVEINTSWQDKGAQLVVNGQVETTVFSSSDVDVSQLGLYEAEYQAVHDGTVYSVKRYVIVTDQTPPVLTLNPGVDTLQTGETWEDPGAEATDNSGETPTLTVSGSVDTTKPGTYEITYEAVDSSGNRTRLTRYVHVID